jgi:hypothetical protein
MSAILKTVLTVLAVLGAPVGYVFYNSYLSPDNWTYQGGSPSNWKDSGYIPKARWTGRSFLSEDLEGRGGLSVIVLECSGVFRLAG